MLLFTNEYIFLDILSQNKCYSTSYSLKEYHLRQWSCLSLDYRREYKGMILCAGNLTHGLVVFKFSYLRNYFDETYTSC